MKYLRKDYLLHFITGAGIAMVSLHFLEWWVALTIVFIIGAAKEIIWDWLMEKGTPEWIDFIATILGGIIIVINNKIYLS